MTEPDVTLTDYAIAALCAVFCVLASRWRTESPTLRRWWIILFGSIGAGALFGGTVHGFFLDTESVGNAVLWRATLLALGVTSAAMWMLGAMLRLAPAAVTVIRGAALVLLAVYAVIVIGVDQRFLIAIAMYLPATVFLLAVFISLARRRQPGIGVGIVGLLLTFVAAAIQQLRIGIHPTWFNHNALYHVVQGIALYMIFRAAKSLTLASPSRSSP
ncbi:MAG TPA: hypothetical protein VEB19_19095 [Gemmatimonadaceae bacterium]|nr:hypothetical protein [Gemmatimonadaceae bacterium]